MEKPMLMSAVLRYFRNVMLLLLVTCSCLLVRSSLAPTNALHNLGDFTQCPYGSIFSPLFKALSEHGGSRWNLSIKEQEHLNECQLCPGIHHALNFTASAGRKNRRNWMEVDITMFLQPLLKFQKQNIHLLINVTWF